MNTYWAVINFTSPAHLRMYIEIAVSGYLPFGSGPWLGWLALGASFLSRTVTCIVAGVILLEVAETWGLVL